MPPATDSRSRTHAGRWFAGGLLLALAALLAWTARQDEAWRNRVAALERENQSLRQALALRNAATPQPATPAAAIVATAQPPPQPQPPGAAGNDPIAAHASPPGSSVRAQGPLEAALQARRETALRAGASPFARP